jgi:ABC-2 type transport system permease protein
MVGLALTLYSVSRLAADVGLAESAAFALTLAAGAAIVYSFWLCLVTLTFWFVKLENIEQIIWQAFKSGRYPIQIYPAWLRLTLTYAIPVAFIITVPAEALTGRLAPGFLAVSAVVAVASVFLSSAFWRFGLRSYTGASA